MYNQQQRPAINKVQIVGMALTVAVVGGVGIRINSYVSNLRDREIASPSQKASINELPDVQRSEADRQGEMPSQIVEKQTQIVIVVPQSPEQIDCIQHGGGMGCFNAEYKPNLPSYYSPASSHWTEQQINNRWERKRRAFYNVYF